MQTNYGAVRQSGYPLPMAALALVFAAAFQPVGVQYGVHVVGATWLADPRCPRGLEALIIVVATLRTRAMAGGECCRLVEEE